MNIIESHLQFSGLSWGNNPKMIVLHHAEASTCSIQDIHQWHLNNGWAGCGYHFLVRKDGSIYRGRPEEAIGSHCHGVNATSLGVCAEGDFTKESMSDAQKNAIVELCKYLCSKYGINSIKGHKELYATECPGNNYPLQQIKDLIGTGASVSTPATNTSILKLWSSGSAVKDLQEKLIKLGYKVTADGIYGPNTYNAVEHFQTSKKLTADGIVGPQTMVMLDMAIANKDVIDIHSVKYLQHAIGAAEDNIQGPATLSKCPILKIGCNSNAVKWVQAKLNIVVDGIFGNGTKIAVQNFQAKNGLAADGIVGQNTWKRLLGL